MVFESEGVEYLTDNDLQVRVVGKYPSVDVKNKKLKKTCGSSLGGDAIISHRQALVARGMDFDGLEDEFLKYGSREEFEKAVFDKTATGIGRGHSMGGLTGVVLGVRGSKMIDSGLTGFVASRSIVTSGRRRSVAVSDIVVPESLIGRKDLLAKYLEVSGDAFKESAEFKTKFGRLGGIESFNKALPYNNPADLFIVMPLDTMATLAFEVAEDKANPNGPFLPRELHTLVDEKFPAIAEENGMGSMYNQRIRVPRDGYFHYNVFKDPNRAGYVSELEKKLGIPFKPALLNSNIDLTEGLKKELESLKVLYEEARRTSDPAELSEMAMRCMYGMRNLVGEYNEAVSVDVFDSLSFRVWSEQKRHSTLRQNVESIYSAAQRAYENVKDVWPQIEVAYKKGEASIPLEKIEKSIVIDNRLKKSPELLVPYIFHSARQLMLYGEMVEAGVPLRDAAYTIPRNTRVLNLERYDLVNLVDLELPLRLCSECEPERYRTSWQKRDLVAKAVPDLKYFLQPKCNVGFCTEGNYCGHVKGMRRDYDENLHKATKEAMLSGRKY